MKNIVNRILESCKTIKRSSVLKIFCNALNTADYDKIEGKDCIDYWKEKKPGIKVHICPACNKPLGDEDVVGGHVIDFYRLLLMFTLRLFTMLAINVVEIYRFLK